MESKNALPRLTPPFTEIIRERLLYILIHRYLLGYIISGRIEESHLREASVERQSKEDDM